MIRNHSSPTSICEPSCLGYVSPRTNSSQPQQSHDLPRPSFCKFRNYWRPTPSESVAAPDRLFTPFCAKFVTRPLSAFPAKDSLPLADRKAFWRLPLLDARDYPSNLPLGLCARIAFPLLLQTRDPNFSFLGITKKLLSFPSSLYV